jgi:PST family polysaccharide transporter
MVTPHFVGAIASLGAAYLLHRWMLTRSVLDVLDLSACFLLSYAVSFFLVYLFPVSRREIRRYVTVAVSS